MCCMPARVSALERLGPTLRGVILPAERPPRNLAEYSTGYLVPVPSLSRCHAARLRRESPELRPVACRNTRATGACLLSVVQARW